MRIGKTGLLVYDEARATPVFTLFSPLMQDQVYLLNMAGEVIHEWIVKGNAHGYSYLLPNGNLLASALAPGTLEEKNKVCDKYVNWIGKVTWFGNAMHPASTTILFA